MTGQPTAAVRHLFPRQESPSIQSLTVASTEADLDDTTLAALPTPLTTSTLSSGSGTSTSSEPAPMNTTATSPEETLIDVGPYSCTTSINFDLITKVLASDLDDTQTNLNATLKYLILNLHVAALPSNPLNSTIDDLSAEDLPQGRDLLSSILTSALPDYIYTPQQLQEQRLDLIASGSWYSVVKSDEADSAYININGSGDDTSTIDGWPSESYVEMDRAKRLFAGFGRIDSGMQDYNFSGDALTIFPEGYLQSRTDVSFESDGDVDDGCFFDLDKYTVSTLNNSWAVTAEDSSSTSSYVSSLIHCGISPTLSQTLGNATADLDYKPYRVYVQNTIWSWADGEPRLSTDLGMDERVQDRCAAMDAESGSWQTENCSRAHYCACRDSGQPYRWSISDSETSYANAGAGCEDGTEFTAPRTALENEYLAHAWREAVSTQDLDDNLLWINFNDLDIKACWVVGQNATCPYLQQSSSDRTVLIPTIAAVIVFVLAALTVFLKCAGNRQRSKRRRRRRDDGWDYEGVPS
ncbi:Maintenance of telomere capping protein 6 [Vermiconidia calcicola]|uniref:Maintenance of telomere capping protein 6 n=1 Tax=Vermiconidia calcicola TaxID=1690605 RepID=A0ACC3MV12_9PEZI|nr:Maintenance of telomere capping protein 6 [Vermiconidia calcicola]